MGVKALIAGDLNAATALASGLVQSGLDVEHDPSLDGAEGRDASAIALGVRTLERRLAEFEPAIAVAVGTGDFALALALGAAKLGIPLVGWPGPDRAVAPPDLADARIIAQLAEVDAGATASDGDATAAAARIREWADLHLSA